MSRRIVAAVALALVTARCADRSTAGVELPLNGVQLPVAGTTPHFLRWGGTAAPRFRVNGPQSGDGSDVSQASPLSLDTYSVSFWAVRGEARSAHVNYVDASGHKSHPFLTLTITDPVTLPDGHALAQGDSVLITVNIDTTNIGVSLEPTGLTFGAPAQMQMWYTGADGDMNGDGVVDATDAYIEAQLLGMWYREGEVSNWERIPATQAAGANTFTVALPHFSHYAVSW